MARRGGGRGKGQAGVRPRTANPGSKPTRPPAPGGTPNGTAVPRCSTDVLARLPAERLSQVLGQPFVVENRARTDAIAKSAPDGHTMGPSAPGRGSRT